MGDFWPVLLRDMGTSQSELRQTARVTLVTAARFKAEISDALNFRF